MSAKSWVLSVACLSALAQLSVAQAEGPAGPAAPTAAGPAAATASAAPAASEPRWSPIFTGSYFTRYELRSGYDDLGLSSASSRARLLEGDAIYYRVRLGIGTGLLAIGNSLKVGLQFTPQTTGTFGNLTATPNAPSTVVDANLGLHEGYARVQGTYARFDAGRFEMNYGDSVVIGQLDWNEIGRSFDGLRARMSVPTSPAWVDVFATLVDEGRPDIVRGQTLDSSPGIGLGDIYFVGAYAALGPAIAKGLDLDAYALVRAWGDAKDVRLNAASPIFRRERAADATLGLRAKQRLGWFDYRFEGGVQTGSRPGAAPTATTADPPAVVSHIDARAFHADLELGTSLAQDVLRVGLEGIYASGNDPRTQERNEGWDELFPTGHRTLGLSDAFVQNGQKRTNVASGIVHLSACPWERLTFFADGFVFARPEKSAQYKNQNGFAAGEVDVGWAWTLAKGLKLRGVYAVFLPNSDLYQDTLPNAALARGADPVHFSELELRYTLE